MAKNKLIWEDDIEEIDVGDGDFVSVSSSVTVKDIAGLSNADGGVGQTLTLLHSLIRSWRGPSFERDGASVPVTPANIDRLDLVTANKITGVLMTKISGIEADDDEKKDFVETLSVSSTIP